MAKPITLTDGSTLKTHASGGRGALCAHGTPDGALIQEFRVHNDELQRRGVWDERWEPASLRWAAQPAELRQAVLQQLGVTR